MDLTSAALCYWLNKLKDEFLGELLHIAFSPKLNSANKCKLKMSTFPRRVTNDPFTHESWAVSSAEYNFGNTSKMFLWRNDFIQLSRNIMPKVQSIYSEKSCLFSPSLPWKQCFQYYEHHWANRKHLEYS